MSTWPIPTAMCVWALRGDQVVHRVRLDRWCDALFAAGLPHGGDQRLVTELLEPVIRVPHRDDPPSAFNRSCDVDLASIGELTARHDLRVDLVVELLASSSDL